MTRDQLIQDMAKLVATSQRAIREGTGMPPTWLMIGADEEARVLVTPWGGDDEKREATAMVRAIMAAFQCSAWLFACEAWGAVQSTDPEVAKLRPSERSDRVELLMVHGGLRDGTRLVRYLELDREPDGGVQFKEDDQGKDDKGRSWLFDHLFDWDYVSETMRHTIRVMWDEIGVTLNKSS